MPKYRKCPVEIEAVQWDGTDEGADALLKALPGAPIQILETCPIQMRIATPEGKRYVSPGDYVIRGVAGEFYPCKPAIFEATYDLVGGGNVNVQ